VTHPIWIRRAANVVAHGASRWINRVGAEVRSMCAPQMPRALPRRCLSPNHPRRTPGDRLSSHAPTCFRGHHRRVALRHARPSDTGFHQPTCAPRTRRVATCQPSWVMNLRSHPNTISLQARSRSRISTCVDSPWHCRTLEGVSLPKHLGTGRNVRRSGSLVVPDRCLSYL